MLPDLVDWGREGSGPRLFQTQRSGPDFISVPSPEAMCLVATIEREFDSSDRFILIERPQSVVEISDPDLWGPWGRG
jgi:hypothetical protein